MSPWRTKLLVHGCACVAFAGVMSAWAMYGWLVQAERLADSSLQERRVLLQELAAVQGALQACHAAEHEPQPASLDAAIERLQARLDAAIERLNSTEGGRASHSRSPSRQGGSGPSVAAQRSNQ